MHKTKVTKDQIAPNKVMLAELVSFDVDQVIAIRDQQIDAAAEQAEIAAKIAEEKEPGAVDEDVAETNVVPFPEQSSPPPQRGPKTHDEYLSDVNESFNTHYQRINNARVAMPAGRSGVPHTKGLRRAPKKQKGEIEKTAVRQEFANFRRVFDRDAGVVLRIDEQVKELSQLLDSERTERRAQAILFGGLLKRCTMYETLIEHLFDRLRHIESLPLVGADPHTIPRLDEAIPRLEGAGMDELYSAMESAIDGFDDPEKDGDPLIELLTKEYPFSITMYKKTLDAGILEASEKAAAESVSESVVEDVAEKETVAQE